ncbi:MAG: hypothetical protein QNJ36_05860 [Calothrix sp. MO_167.B42]|nr:hypothetical protein [Calothrix sp. MO_167.B42]
MSSDFFDLSTFHFTDTDDVVNPGKTIFNPGWSTVKTLKGDDQLIGTSSLGFDLRVTVETAAEDIGLGSNPVDSSTFTAQAKLNINGIINKGNLYTNRGHDLVSGKAVALISAQANTITQAIAIANTVDASAMAASLAVIDITAIANGIKNTGEIGTGSGNDTVDGEVIAAVRAEATATLDVLALATAVAQEPFTEGLQAVATGFAQSLAKAKVVATGINNRDGELRTNRGEDNIFATANSFSTLIAEAEASVFANAAPENKALVQGIFDAVAQVEDKAIAIDNTYGYISLGSQDDKIEARAKASDEAIAINNTHGDIYTGGGDDEIIAYASGNKSYGIVGGYIDTDDGNDKIIASSFGGDIDIDMGSGKDYAEGFGDATIDGGDGFDTLNLGSYKKSDFHIYYDWLGGTMFELKQGGTTMATYDFEQFNFADGSYSYHQL